MLLKLSGPALRPLGATSAEPFVGRVVAPTGSATPSTDVVRVPAGAPIPVGAYRAYLFDEPPARTGMHDAFVLGADWHYIAPGDVLRIDPSRGTLNVLYRHASSSNSLLVTERCDNYCVMCSQPPKARDDSWIVDELEMAIPLIPTDAREIGLSGGEPALLGQRLVHLIKQLKHHLPETAVHVLTNGRRFADSDFARSLADVRHPDLMLGIPLYSDLPESHDFVVQARGAYEDTIRGILNLKRSGVRVELRFVIHAETVARMPDFALFVARNLRFVDHVALMGLELMGFAQSNVESLWIDPLDYTRELVETVKTLDRAGVRTSIYNHQLCVLPPEVRQFAVRSISDWKNAFLEQCTDCSVRNECGGFFASVLGRPSRGVAPI